MSVLLALAAAIVPTRVGTPPHVDGHLDDAAWQTVAASEQFTQAFPHDGAAPSEPTRIQVAYDDDNLYIAVDCTQTIPIVARLTRRDRDVDGDRVAVDVDTGHDRRSAFHFQVSAAGVLVDGLRYDDTELSTDWDEVWDAQVTRTDHGWSAELRIPLRILRLRDSVATWGFQVRRYVADGEIDTWAYAPRDAGGEVSRYGELGPFDGITTRGSLALVPFALSRVTRSDAGMPSLYGNGVSSAAGVDLTWRPAPEIALAAALRPDFGQVEADQVIINLGTTEIEYPEKRPFFLQGMDLFQTPMQLLYTRRIGLSAPMDGAAKLVASAGPVDIGALSAVTSASDDGAIAPASHHVVRVRASSGGTTVGALATAQVMQDRQALAGGVDSAWRSDDGTWAASGQLAGTQIDGGQDILRPDGTVIHPGDSGLGGTAHLAKDGGTLRASLDVDAYSRKFDIDNLGYLPRANVRHGELDLEAYTAHEHGPMLESRSRIEIFWRQNSDGLALPSGYQWNVSGTGKGMWTGFLELHWRPAYFDDRELGDGRALERSGRLGIELGLSSDPRRAVVAQASATARSTHAGGETYLSGALAIRPRTNVELSVEPDFEVTRGEPRFVDGADPAGPRFARQDATTLGVTTRLTWTLRRDLTLQAYTQALLAAIHYRDPFVADPTLRVISLNDLRAATFDPTMYDLREGVLNATAVARWEYRPGSTAYLVYTHAQVPTTDRASWDPAALVRGPEQDVLLLKVSWAWLR